MNSFLRLFRRDDKFFTMLEASAAEARNSVGLLVSRLKNSDRPITLDDFVASRRRDRHITEEISNELCQTFVTPVEREDIQTLSAALYKIPKTVEKFCELYMASGAYVHGVTFSPQLALLDQCAETVAQMVGGMRRHSSMQTARDLNARLQHLEGDADELMMSLLKDLFDGTHEPMKVIVVMNLHEILEGIIDRCRDAGNTVLQITLKCS